MHSECQGEKQRRARHHPALSGAGVKAAPRCLMDCFVNFNNSLDFYIFHSGLSGSYTAKSHWDDHKVKYENMKVLGDWIQPACVTKSLFTRLHIIKMISKPE